MSDTENERDRLRAEVEALKTRVAELEESASMACECPSGCDCAGCRSNARRRVVTALGVGMPTRENELDRLRSALQVAEQKNTELVAETWKLGTEIEERAIEQARLREALQAAERERDEAREANRRYGERYGLAIGARDKALDERNEALAEASELRAEVERLRERLHRTAHILIAQIGASGPEDADSVAKRAVARIVQYRSALGFYAAAETWIYSREESEDSDIVEVDGEPQTWPGKRAREALGK